MSTREDYERAAAFHRERCEAAGPHDPEGCGYCRTAALLQEAAERMTWKPIETAPKDREILVGDITGSVTVACWTIHQDPEGWSEGGGPVLSWPTHWLPLPPAPGEPSAEEGV